MKGNSRIFQAGGILGCLVILLAQAYLKPKNGGVSACLVNLRQIELAKKAWAEDNARFTLNRSPSWSDLRPYVPQEWPNGIPVCPDGGTYTVRRLGEPPQCSVDKPGHQLPF